MRRGFGLERQPSTQCPFLFPRSRQTVAYETDERLKGYLDTNQMHREQMGLAVLAIFGAREN